MVLHLLVPGSIINQLNTKFHVENDKVIGPWYVEHGHKMTPHC